MPNKENWKRDHEIERNDRTVKYAWRNRQFKDYTLVVVDLKKELGRFHPDYEDSERYAIDLEHEDQNFYTEYEGNVNAAFNTAVDIQEEYIDPRELHLEPEPDENDSRENFL